jgi:hypothetical protein
MDKVPWILLIVGILLFFAGVSFGAATPESFMSGILIGSVGGCMAMVGIVKLRNKFNRWLDQ